ncbi:hypothetical protein [Mesorhizobium sp.]|uniref:hypothetical protein n=1 Tax=Mesorhizobium sp. TaxID=1871066 RepID=UPI0025D3FACB|nr:hypothetical protein [Mesorhizobium sp.]
MLVSGFTDLSGIPDLPGESLPDVVSVPGGVLPVERQTFCSKRMLGTKEPKYAVGEIFIPFRRDVKGESAACGPIYASL